ncbi:hypothetical protein QAD02_008790 [Eretmocerus hayati]|uniref:Uncharacterized protein n=1 Tax=Eretmocerus hayati TaxID=131215 RepID=A0ACC2N8R7_9HYME|nr:hypothetical protein QAD02_008790 [Eretmocerus hayati]
MSVLISKCTSSRSLSFGKSDSNFLRLNSKIVNRDGFFLLKIEEETTINVKPHQTIEQISILGSGDKLCDATIKIVSGGIGCNFVTLNFESARGCGIHYWVGVFGKK